jgi:hypothetical protein
MSLLSEEAALMELRAADAEGATLRLRRLEKEFEVLRLRQPWLCEGLNSAEASEEKLQCLRDIGSVNELFLQCYRAARNVFQGIRRFFFRFGRNTRDRLPEVVL